MVPFFFKQKTAYELGLGIPAEPLFRSIEVDCWRKMRKFDLSLRSSRSSYFATFRHQLTILSKTDALDEEKWLNMLGTRSEERFSRNAETELVCRLLLEKKNINDFRDSI